MNEIVLLKQYIYISFYLSLYIPTYTPTHRLHNEMKYSASLSACTENNGHHSPLAKIQHLEELVFDLEASERSLQKELNHVNHNETKLGKQMFDNKPDQNNVVSRVKTN